MKSECIISKVTQKCKLTVADSYVYRIIIYKVDAETEDKADNRKVNTCGKTTKLNHRLDKS